jgi:hypothetical protein
VTQGALIDQIDFFLASSFQKTKWTGDKTPTNLNPSASRKGNSLVMLMAWWVWKQRNADHELLQHNSIAKCTHEHAHKHKGTETRSIKAKEMKIS